MTRANVVSLLVLSALMVCAHAAGNDYSYAVVIDAGSSGCKVMAFAIPKPAAGTGGDLDCNSIVRERQIRPVQPEMETTIQKIVPGVATFVNNMAGLDAYLAKVIAAAQTIVPPTLQHETPIYLQATAGMRLLSVEEQAAIVSVIRATFGDKSKCPFRFEKESDAGVIPGKFEGVYDWLSVNYIRQSLPGFEAPSPHNHTDPDLRKHVGAIDMGGGSVEVAFLPSEPPKHHRVRVELGAQTWNLYSYSWLHYGWLEAHKVVAEHVIRADVRAGSGAALNPCWLNGFMETTANGTVVKGTGDHEACRLAVREALIKADKHCENPGPCALAGVYTPALPGTNLKMILESAFAYTWNHFSLGPKGTVPDLEASTKQYCALSWDDAVATYPASNVAYLQKFCFAGTYFSELIARFGLGDPTTAEGHKMRMLEKVDGWDLDWTYGFLLVEKCGRIL